VSPIRLLPWVVHEAIEYIAGVFFILAPFIFEFQTQPAFPVFVGVGVLILAVALLSKGPAGVLRILPPTVHAALDYMLGFFLLLAPFIFGFRRDMPALTISILLGVAHLVVTLVTRFPAPDTDTT
jgi:hypothetical protein